ncbi:MAG: serine hydrolase [Candidatus Pseudobacter hemicellulosilyticus]|uniref:Serine hydrolase n=1 Tax=Candidatus Pseudobacter hemicellulosilyticus TaxID=3121375 RepID=A0AAJ6BGZ5_9BACT|nr:MAG: serine hydrolase [Pseudobacter sp.]
MHKYLLSILAMALLGGAASAQYNFTKLDNWLQQHVGELGGRTYLVIYKDGKTIYSKGVNAMTGKQKAVVRFLAKRQGKAADLADFTLHSRQPIASCSKWLSAALVMTFVDEGRLQLTDTIGSYLPIFSRQGKGHITISQCLSHLTAIKAPPLKESLQEMREVNSMEEAMAGIALLPMEGEPGKVFHYSNIGLQIAGAVIEKISGQSFQQLFRERITQPLGMRQTDFGDARVPLPAGGAWSTPEDYLHFLAMILQRGQYQGRQLLQEKSIAAMQVNQLTKEVKQAYSPAEATGFGYGFGEWVMSAANGAATGSVSSPGLFGSYPWVDNQRGYAAFLMTVNINNKGRNEKYRELKKLVDEALEH